MGNVRISVPKTPLPVSQQQQDSGWGGSLPQADTAEPAASHWSSCLCLCPPRNEERNPPALVLPIFPPFSTPLPPPHISSHIATKNIECEERKKKIAESESSLKILHQMPGLCAWIFGAVQGGAWQGAERMGLEGGGASGEGRQVFLWLF